MFWKDEETKLSEKMAKEIRAASRLKASYEIRKRREVRVAIEDEEEKARRRTALLAERADAIFLAHGWMYDWRGWLIKVVKGVMYKIEYRGDKVVLLAKVNERFKIVLKGDLDSVGVVEGRICIGERLI